MSALENVSLPLELDGVPSRIARERAAGALERVELSHRANHIPSKLSGGEQQRVAVARAIVIEPAILLADEPTGNLDSRQSERVTALLRSLAADHKHTIVMVTHDAKVARSAFRLLMFRDGMIERDVHQSEFEHGFPAGDSGTFMRPNLSSSARNCPRNCPVAKRSVVKSPLREIANASRKALTKRDSKQTAS